MTLRSADFESAASASSAIPAWEWATAFKSIAQPMCAPPAPPKPHPQARGEVPTCADQLSTFARRRSQCESPCDNGGNRDDPASSAVVPSPVAVTPQLLAQHSITAEEYERILAALGRTPSLTELGIYSVMW